MDRLTYSDRQVFEKFGFTLRESARFRDVSRLFGRGLAESELRTNLLDYKDEFLDDKPLSRRHTYHLYDSEFYSQPIHNGMFKLKTGVNKSERGGMMYEGLKRYEKLMEKAPDGEVVSWYSPEGNSNLGTEFDAGRWYIGFKTEQTETVHFNVKTRPEFPILDLLTTLAHRSGHEPPFFENEEQGKMYYLTHPFTTGLSGEEFFGYIDTLMKRSIVKPDETMYISKRFSSDRTVHSFQSIMQNLRARLLQNEEDEFVKIHSDRLTDGIVTEEFIMHNYLNMIAPYLVKEAGGTVYLYGCSGTSTITMNEFGKFNFPPHILREIIESNKAFKGARSIFDSLSKYSSESFPCPDCGHSIPSGKGIEQCPTCYVTKDQVAARTGVKCD